MPTAPGSAYAGPATAPLSSSSTDPAAGWAPGPHSCRYSRPISSCGYTPGVGTRRATGPDGRRRSPTTSRTSRPCSPRRAGERTSSALPTERSSPCTPLRPTRKAPTGKASRRWRCSNHHCSPPESPYGTRWRDIGRWSRAGSSRPRAGCSPARSRAFRRSSSTRSVTRPKPRTPPPNATRPSAACTTSRPWRARTPKPHRVRRPKPRSCSCKAPRPGTPCPTPWTPWRTPCPARPGRSSRDRDTSRHIPPPRCSPRP